MHKAKHKLKLHAKLVQKHWLVCGRAVTLGKNIRCIYAGPAQIYYTFGASQARISSVLALARRKSKHNSVTVAKNR